MCPIAEYLHTWCRIACINCCRLHIDVCVTVARNAWMIYRRCHTISRIIEYVKRFTCLYVFVCHIWIWKTTTEKQQQMRATENPQRERESEKKEPATTIFTCNKIWIGIYLFNVHFVLSHSLTPNSLPCSYKHQAVCLCVCFFLAIGRRWKLHMTTSWMNSVSDEIQCISAPNFFLISLSPTIKYASFDDPKQIKWLHMEMDGRKFPKHHRKQFRRHNTLQSAQMTRSHKMVLVRKLCSFLHITHLYMARITLWGIPQCQMMFGMVCLCCWPFFRHLVRENRQK